MEKRRKVLNVAGYAFNITTDATDKEIQIMTQRVDLKIQSFQRESVKLGKEACAVLAALDFCDDAIKAEKTAKELTQSVNDLTVDNKLLREENEDAQNKITSLEKEVEALKKELEKHLVASYEKKKSEIASSSEKTKGKKQKAKNKNEVKAEKAVEDTKAQPQAKQPFIPYANNAIEAIPQLKGQISLFEE